MAKKTRCKGWLAALIYSSINLFMMTQSGTALAHNPIFGIGPHVLFKNGLELAAVTGREKAGPEKESELGVEIVYGITGDWAAGLELPYAVKDEGSESSSGISDIQLFTKYRFWRKDSLGLQESAAVLLAINSENGDENADPPLGNGATDFIAGITYGYESLKWYRWTSLRLIMPGKNDAEFQFGDKLLIDFVAGWRPGEIDYRKADTVWLLELNGESSDRAELNGSRLGDSGGTEWFISPGIFWTTRNFAIKSGVQIPLASSLNGSQDESDYRFKATFEWHL